MPNAEQFCARTAQLDLRHLYRPFQELVPPGGHILDAGCGSGRDSLYFQSAGYQVTAFDASRRMVEAASRLLGRPVQLMTFQELDFSGAFDGIWACASLLHVPRREMQGVLARLARALVPGGVLYASFKYGDGEGWRGERLFNSYDEQSFAELLQSVPALSTTQVWQTTDVRPDRADERWLNALLTRTPPERREVALRNAVNALPHRGILPDAGPPPGTQ